MKNIKLKLLCLILVFGVFIFKPVKAGEGIVGAIEEAVNSSMSKEDLGESLTDGLIVEVLDETQLEKNFDESLLVQLVQEKDIEQLTQGTEELQNHLNKLDTDLESIISKINSMESELDNLEMTPEQLNKYARAGNVDIAEKEIYEGMSYDKDIFDHGKELADKDTRNFQATYLQL
jgi:predicted RNase H-like nuclease (RuvC/YqgF family)